MSSKGKTEIWNLPEGIDLDKSVFRTFYIPGTGTEKKAPFLISGKRMFSCIQERATESQRSWTWQNVIYPPSSVLFTVEVDPCFFIAANLDDKEARTWPEVTANLPEFAADEKVLAFRDKCAKAIGDYYVANDAALLSWYKRMFAKMLLHQKDEFNVYSTDKTQKVHFIKVADFCVYVPERLHSLFLELFPPSIRETRPPPAVIVIKEADEDRCAPPPAKMMKVSASQKRLEKAAKGTASIASFFGKK